MDFGYIRISLDARETGTVDASKISGEGTAWAWLKEHQGQVMCLPPHQGLRGSHWLACTQQALDARETGTVDAGKKSGESTSEKYTR